MREIGKDERPIKERPAENYQKSKRAMNKPTTGINKQSVVPLFSFIGVWKQFLSVKSSPDATAESSRALQLAGVDVFVSFYSTSQSDKTQ